MDLRTTQMGLSLKNPIVAGASPLSREIGSIRALEDAGAAAVVLHSLFEEQIRSEAERMTADFEAGTESFAEALSYFPQAEEYTLGPEEYLEHIRLAKDAVDIPVIASLNGCALGGWIDHATKMEQAGADAIELNVYFIPTDPAKSGADVEKVYVDILSAVKRSVKIPVAIKLHPFFSSVTNVAMTLDKVGTDALVLFNRFYQPDIDLDTLIVTPRTLLSTPQALRLPMRWIAILHSHIKADLIASSGVHTGEDALKLLMVGAKAVQVCSALLRQGPGHVETIIQEMQTWMEENEYESVTQMIGSMSQQSCPEPAAFERAHYMRALTSYHV